MAAAQAKLMQASNILKVASFRKITMNKAGNVSDHAAALSSLSAPRIERVVRQ